MDMDLSFYDVMAIKNRYSHKVAFVSPELHGRSPYRQWDTLRALSSGLEQWYLCTDYIQNNTKRKREIAL